jgi:hypothetical protein
VGRRHNVDAGLDDYDDRLRSISRRPLIAAGKAVSHSRAADHRTPAPASLASRRRGGGAGHIWRWRSRPLVEPGDGSGVGRIGHAPGPAAMDG